MNGRGDLLPVAVEGALACARHEPPCANPYDLERAPARHEVWLWAWWCAEALLNAPSQDEAA